jgi:uncharacterized protein YcgI (DUF1989 family)
MSSNQPISKVHIPPQSGGGAIVRRGQRLKVIALQGKQVGDLFAFVLDAPDEYLSPAHTRSKLRLLYPRLGEPLYSNKRKPLLLIEEDTVRVHDLLAPACDPFFYQELGKEGHPNCRDNLVVTLKEFALSPVGLPDPVNLFQNTPVIDLEGHREVRESIAKAGDYVLFQVLEDLLVVVTACSVDWPPLNGDKPSDLMLEVYA